MKERNAPKRAFLFSMVVSLGTGAAHAGLGESQVNEMGLQYSQLLQETEFEELNNLVITKKKGPTLWVRGNNFVALDQTNTKDTSLYVSSNFANTVVGKKARWEETCLATVYAMIDKSMLNGTYRIGESTWGDSVGAYAPAGLTKADKGPSMAINEIKAEFEEGDPVIVQVANSSVPTHWVLAVGIDAENNLIALDPWRAGTIVIQTQSMTTNSQVHEDPLKVVNFRTIDIQ